MTGREESAETADGRHDADEADVSVVRRGPWCCVVAVKHACGHRVEYASTSSSFPSEKPDDLKGRRCDACERVEGGH